MQQVILSGVLYSQLLDDLRSMVRAEVRETQLSTPPVEPGQQQLLTVREAAELLQVSVQTIHSYKKSGLLAYKKLSGRTYLLRETILAALQSHQRMAKTDRTCARRQRDLVGQNP